MAQRSYNGRELVQNPKMIGSGSTTSENAWIGDVAYRWRVAQTSGGNNVLAEFISFEDRNCIKFEVNSLSRSGGTVSQIYIGNLAEYAGGTINAANLALYGIRIRPGYSYQLKLTYKLVALGADTGAIRFFAGGTFYNTNGTRDNLTFNLLSQATTTDWTTVTATFNTAKSMNAFLGMRIGFVANDDPTTNGNGIVYLSEISVTEVLPVRNVASNRNVITNRVAVRDMGTALRFGATGANVTTDDNVMPNFSTVDYTLSAWVKGNLMLSNVASDQQCIFGSGQTSPYWYLALRNGNYLLRYQDAGEDRQATTRQRPSQRVFLTVLLDKTNLRLRLYVNSVLAATQSVTSFSDLLSETLKIGFLTGQTSFNGIIDETRMWNRILTDTEIQNLYFKNIIPKNGLIDELLFNETSGSVALDTSGLGNDGTITGATYTTDVPLRARTVV